MGVPAADCSVAVGALGGVWARHGAYGLNVLVRHGGIWWVDVGTDSRRTSRSMRLALGADPVATPGDVR